jgi:hypothetical protein
LLATRHAEAYDTVVRFRSRVGPTQTLHTHLSPMALRVSGWRSGGVRKQTAHGVQWQCSAVQWSAVAVAVQWQCSDSAVAVAVQCSAVECSGSAMECSGVQWQCSGSAMECSAVECSGSAVECSAVQCSGVQYMMGAQQEPLRSRVAWARSGARVHLPHLELKRTWPDSRSTGSVLQPPFPIRVLRGAHIPGYAGGVATPAAAPPSSVPGTPPGGAARQVGL